MAAHVRPSCNLAALSRAEHGTRRGVSACSDAARTTRPEISPGRLRPAPSEGQRRSARCRERSMTMSAIPKLLFSGCGLHSDPTGAIVARLINSRLVRSPDAGRHLASRSSYVASLVGFRFPHAPAPRKRYLGDSRRRAGRDHFGNRDRCEKRAPAARSLRCGRREHVHRTLGHARRIPARQRSRRYRPSAPDAHRLSGDERRRARR